LRITGAKMRDIYDDRQTIPSLSDSRAGRKAVSYIGTLPERLYNEASNRESIIIKKQGTGYPTGISRTVFPHTKNSIQNTKKCSRRLCRMYCGEWMRHSKTFLPGEQVFLVSAGGRQAEFR